jgi:hypothetical protein
LLYYYFEYKAKNGTDVGTSVAQHQYMADHFVKQIAEAIRQQDNYKYPLEYYLGFGWDGLRKYGYDMYNDNGKIITLTKKDSDEFYNK